MEIALSKAWDYLRTQNPKYLGGSTGAVLMTLPNGEQVVVKRGAHPKHITNEYDMNRYLDKLGLGVPKATLERDRSGSPVMLTEYEEGARQPSLSEPQDVRALRQDFVPQALIANWDVLGQNMDNVLIRPDGTPTYVDVGGAGPYRAQGGEKGTAWSPDANAELESMQSVMPHSEQVYGGMTPEELTESYDLYGGQDAMEQAMSALRDSQTKNVMQQRIEDVARRVDSL